MQLIKVWVSVFAFFAGLGWLLWGIGDDADRIGIVLVVWASASIPAGLVFGEMLKAAENEND